MGDVVALRKGRAFRAQHILETNHELASVLTAKRDKSGNLEEPASDKEAARQRKLARMQAVRQTEGQAEPLVLVRYCRM